MSERRAKIFGQLIRADRQRRELDESLLALETLWANLAIGGALCATHERGAMEMVRPTEWHPGCCIPGGLYDTEMPFDTPRRRRG